MLRCKPKLTKMPEWQPARQLQLLDMHLENQQLLPASRMRCPALRGPSTRQTHMTRAMKNPSPQLLQLQLRGPGELRGFREQESPRLVECVVAQSHQRGGGGGRRRPIQGVRRNVFGVSPHLRALYTQFRGNYSYETITPALSFHTKAPGHFTMRASRSAKGIRHQISRLLKRVKRAIFVNGVRHNKKQARAVIERLLQQHQTVDIRLA